MEENKVPEEVSGVIKEKMHDQFMRGMYVASYGLSGAIVEMIEKLEKKPKKKLADYQSTLIKIKSLCQKELKNPDEQEDAN